jgi:hypothetical protein
MSSWKSLLALLNVPIDFLGRLFLAYGRIQVTHFVQFDYAVRRIEIAARIGALDVTLQMSFVLL